MLLRIVISILCLLMLTAPATAQELEEAAPLVFFGRGLYTMREGDPRVSPWNDCGDGSWSMSISPTGDWIVRSIEAANVRVCNPRTREVRDIIRPNTSPNDDIAHVSYPSWSPDSTDVAWSAVINGVHQLWIGSLVTYSARLIVDELPVGTMKPQVLWGENGILIVIGDRDPEVRRAPLYSPFGELLLEDLASSQFFAFYVWVTDAEGKEYLARYTNFAVGDVVDPQTGDTAIPQAIEMYSPLAPDGISIDVNAASTQTQAVVPDDTLVLVNELHPWLSNLVPVPYLSPRNISIAPDGEAFAVFDLAGITWRDGLTTELPESIPSADGTGVIWGPAAYRIRGELLTPAG